MKQPKTGVQLGSMHWGCCTQRAKEWNGTARRRFVCFGLQLSKGQATRRRPSVKFTNSVKVFRWTAKKRSRGIGELQIKETPNQPRDWERSFSWTRESVKISTSQSSS